MQTLGEIIRQQREKRGLLLRQVGAAMDVDQALVSKFERGERNPNREQVIQFANLFDIDKNELIVAWLSDKLVLEVQNEDLALKALQIAEEKVRVFTKNKKRK